MEKCLQCKIATNNPKFCSRSCSTTHRNKTRQRKRKYHCQCGVAIRHGVKLCPTCLEAKKASFKKRTIREYQELLSVKGKHPSWVNAHVRHLGRRWNNELLGLPCHKCGYSKHVELCHIKPISEFPLDTPLYVVHDQKNVIQLCRNCHWEFDHGMLSAGELGLEPR